MELQEEPDNLVLPVHYELELSPFYVFEHNFNNKQNLPPLRLPLPLPLHMHTWMILLPVAVVIFGIATQIINFEYFGNDLKIN